MIGLAGAHRTGKTTLALAFCKAHPEYSFLPTNLSSVFTEKGITPKSECPFAERLYLQNLLLDKCEEVYASVDNSMLVITDRTPFDVAAYTLAEVGRTTLHGDESLTRAYWDHVNRAKDIAAKYLNVIVQIQPGIKIVEAEGKAPGCSVYIEHLNILMDSLVYEFGMEDGYSYIMGRRCTDLNDRVKNVWKSLSDLTEIIKKESEYCGGFIQ